MAVNWTFGLRPSGGTTQAPALQPLNQIDIGTYPARRCAPLTTGRLPRRGFGGGVACSHA